MRPILLTALVLVAACTSSVDGRPGGLVGGDDGSGDDGLGGDTHADPVTDDETQHVVPDYGADVAFTTIEAESGATNGSVVRLVGLPDQHAVNPEREASGLAYVALVTAGDYVEMTGIPASDTLVVRHCMPDASGGGGTTATLSLYVNGVRKTALSLSSHYSWLYGDPSNNGQSNNPSDGDPHVYWDEQRFTVDAIPAGATVRFQKDAGDAAAFYWLDSVDFEKKRDVLTAPPGALDFGTYAGADATGATDSTIALRAALADAKAQKKTLWIPAGRFVISDNVTIDSVVVQGAGMWFTEIFRNTPMPRPGNGDTDYRFYTIFLEGDGAGLHDVFIDSTGTGRGYADSGDYGVLGAPTNFAITNVWITHTGTGFWLGGANGVIRYNRVRGTYADGINLNNGAQNVNVEQNHVRGTGDDGIAALSELNDNKPPTAGLVIRYNTIINPWWAGSIDIAGGRDHVIERNFMEGNALGGCLILNSPGAYAMEPLERTTFRANHLVRCGNNGFGQHRGAIWTLAESAAFVDITFDANRIEASLARGIDLEAEESQQLLFTNNVIDMQGGGEQGIFIGGGVTGSGQFTGNQVLNLASGFDPLTNQSSAFTVTKSGNTF